MDVVDLETLNASEPPVGAAANDDVAPGPADRFAHAS